jgi:predicted DCC family thiol-disulfide oxidoreductase YuxK
MPEKPATAILDPAAPAVILFDGVCNLCNASVNFIIDRDPQGRFSFAALQGEIGQGFLRRHGLATEVFDTLVLIDQGRLHQRSGAALRIARRLRWPWPLLAVCWLVPLPLRDAVYGLVSRNRYRWFGRQDACRLPTPQLGARFLDPVA